VSTITVCKNVIMQNNKRKWKNPDQPVRIAGGRKMPASAHCFDLAIMDASGNEVAYIRTTEDGQPIVRCGAKVANRHGLRATGAAMTIDEAIDMAKDELEVQIRRVIQMSGSESNDAIFRVHDGFTNRA
jgi:hypothetical protein